MISIVIPVYKVEKYLPRCLDSIIAQTYTDWECILVDDKSPDNSGKICDAYAEKDRRFVVLHKENSGANLSREAGFKIVHGEYIIFLDSDDCHEKNMLEKLHTAICENEADMAICSWSSNMSDKSTNHYLPTDEHFIKNEDIVEKYLIPSVWSLPGQDGYPSFWCLRLIKKCCIPEDCFVSERNALPEDLISQIHIALRVKRIAIVNEPLYHYWLTPNSLTNTIVNSGLEKRIECYRQIKKLLEENNLWIDSTRERMDYFLVCAIHFAVTNACRMDSYSSAKKIFNDITKDSLLSDIISSYDFSKCGLQKKMIKQSLSLRLFYPLYKYMRWRIRKYNSN